MSYETITQATRDKDLIERVAAAISKEAWANPDYGATGTGQSVKANGPDSYVNYFMWPVAIDNETAYEYAVNSENPAPGSDPGVISDAAIQSGVQTHWPDPPTLEVQQLPTQEVPA